MSRGYFGGVVDWLIGRIVDVWMSFPPVILSLILMVGLGTGLRQRDPRDRAGGLDALLPRAAQRGAGGDARATMSRPRGWSASRTGARSRARSLPATVPLLITLVSLEMGIAVIVEAILSFVGLSVGAQTPAWGQMIADAAADIYESPLESAVSDPRDLRHGVRLQSSRRRPAAHARRPPASRAQRA